MKPIRWVGSSRTDVQRLPVAVREVFGNGLYLAQCGDKPTIAKPLKGFPGSGVLELIEDHRGNAYRAVYTVRFADAVYVLHVFQKKSKSGIKTPKHEIELIRERLRQAQNTTRINMATRKRTTRSVRHSVQAGSGNVFDDLGLRQSDARLAKAELARQIAMVVDEAGWTQKQAAERLDIDQPKVSALLRGHLQGFSTDRLIRFLNAIGQEVEIVVRPSQRKGASPRRPPFRVTRLPA